MYLEDPFLVFRIRENRKMHLKMEGIFSVCLFKKIGFSKRIKLTLIGTGYLNCTLFYINFPLDVFSNKAEKVLPFFSKNIFGAKIS